MKKITLLLSLLVCVAFVNAQTNLLTNGSFEGWADGKPTGWQLPASTVTGVTVTEDATIVKSGKSMKIVVDSKASANPGFFQSVEVTPGKTYKFEISYYIEAGDNTDARVWSNFKKDATTFFTDAELGALLNDLKGPGGASGYFPDVKGQWNTYSIEVTAPAGATFFNFEFRAYKGATVYFDECIFAEKTGNGIFTPNVTASKFVVSGNDLLVAGLADGTVVEVYNTLGAKVQTSVASGERVDVSGLAKGLYIVRAGKYSQKIML